MSALPTNQANRENQPAKAGVVEVPEHTLLRQIGSGSYGEVWLARHTFGAFRAIKIVYRSKFADERPYERELSGIQKFEPISRVHEGLMDVLFVGHNREAGCFYYIMELADDTVTGSQIDPEHYRACTMTEVMTVRQILPIADCVSLGIRLASALEFLHSRGLTHRDIKPSNIILAGGVPKLADIGLVTDLGEAHSYVGTEGFIPPEGPGTIQADIYSLGKVLYELSTGKDRRDFPALPAPRSAPVEEAEFLELNEILLQACRTDPRERYETARALQDDLLLLQSGNSVRQLRLTQRRLRIATRVASVVVVLAGLVLAAFLLARGETRRAERTSERETQLRRVADQEARNGREIVRFLEEMLSGVGHDVAKGKDTALMREVLDRAAQRIRTELTNQPQVRLEVSHTLAEAYRAIGQHADAEDMFRAVLRLTRQLRGDANLDLATALLELADIFTEAEAVARYPEGEDNARAALAMRRKLQGPAAWDVSTALLILGDLQARQNKLPEAESSFFEAWQIRRQLRGDGNFSTAGALDALAAIVEREGKGEQAEAWFLEVMAGRRKWMLEVQDAEKSLDVAHTATHLGKLYRSQHEPGKAESYFREALELRQKWLGDHPETASSLANLAALLWEQRRFQDAEVLYRQELALRDKIQKRDHPDRLACQTALAGVLREEGKDPGGDPSFVPVPNP